jgi:hypothetical protein
MAHQNIPQIVLIGLDTNLIQIIAAFIGHKYQIIAINRQFTVDQLENYMSILLMIIDTDQVFIKMEPLLKALKESPKYQNIPLVGLSLKQHFPKMPIEIRNQFEDFILMPNSQEDLLTRIEIWICTYLTVCDDTIAAKTYSLDEIQAK